MGKNTKHDSPKKIFMKKSTGKSGKRFLISLYLK
jgi:hypothetical protein